MNEVAQRPALPLSHRMLRAQIERASTGNAAGIPTTLHQVRTALRSVLVSSQPAASPMRKRQKSRRLLGGVTVFRGAASAQSFSAGPLLQDILAVLQALSGSPGDGAGWCRIIHAMREYRGDAEWEVARWEHNYVRLPPRHRHAGSKCWLNSGQAYTPSVQA